ncbi:MAG: periplasmic heavy metal sensor [Bacteroidota bacterium]
MGAFVWKEFIQKPPHLRADFHPPFPPHHRGPNKNHLSKILKEKLDLSKEQVILFDKLRADFHKQENKVLQDLRAGRDSMNVEMFNKNTDDNLLNSIAKRVSENEFKMELLKIEQAKQLKAICNKQQLEKFEDLMKEIRDYFKPEHKPK